MHLVREIITKGIYHDDTMEAKYHILQKQIPGMVHPTVHSRQLMQFELVANTLEEDNG